MPNNIEPFLRHEALDRTWLMVDTIERNLMDHGGFTPSELERVEQAFEILSQLYTSWDHGTREDSPLIPPRDDVPLTETIRNLVLKAMPSYFDDLLAKIELHTNNGDPDRIVAIAGGSLRDLVLGGPIKDVDVFVPVPDYEDYMAKHTKQSEVCVALLSISEKAKLQETVGSTLAKVSDNYLGNQVYTVPILPGFPAIEVNVIYVKPFDNVKDLVEQFDLNSSFIAHTLDRGVYIAPEFEEFYKSREIRAVNTGFPKTKYRVQRLVAKYPDLVDRYTETLLEEEDEIPF